MKPGRNEPCPCGSGQKYKRCCLSPATGASTIPAGLTPAELVLARGAAFGRGDFRTIYDSYHPDSPFIGNFPDRDEYLRYGAETLAADFEIRQCRILREKTGETEAQVLFYLETLYQGERNESFELSLFRKTGEGWRYHSSCKMERSEFSGALEDIDWDDFDTGSGETCF